MATAVFGEFEDSKVYVDTEVASRWGKSVKATRAILRDNFEAADLGGGTLIISGYKLRIGVERMAENPVDLDEHENTPRRVKRRTARKRDD